jgi:hypothetical protein
MRNKIIAKTQAKNPYIIESDNEIVSDHSSDNEIEEVKMDDLDYPIFEENE